MLALACTGEGRWRESGPIDMTLLAILVAALVVLAAVSSVVPQRVMMLASAGACGLAILLAVAALADPAEMTTLPLPVGPAGAAMHLSLDPLGACVLLLLFIAGLACAVCLEASPVTLAGMALIVMAGDAFVLAAGLLLLGGRASLRLATLSVVCLVTALALAAAPGEWAAGAMLVLVLLGSGMLTGLLAETSTLLAIAGPMLAVYLPIHLLLKFGGPAQPLWWGLPLVLLGAFAVLFGTLRAALASTLQSVLSIGSLHQLGLASIGLGVALIARAMDRPDLASLALDSVWLSLVCHVLCRTVLLLAANAVEKGAGTRRLDRLGGLLHGMRMTSITALAGLAGIIVLPPGLGFAAFWLLFQSLLGLARAGDLGLRLLVAALAVIVALSVGLAALAAVRLFGVAFLGRPRTPRAAVSEEAPRPIRLMLAGLAGLTLVLGAVPALALFPAMPALARLAGGDIAVSAFPLLLRTGAEAPGYAPEAIAVLLMLGVGVVLAVRLRIAAPDQRREAAWSGGFTPPPPWLPFGDPVTQYGPESFAEPLRRVLNLLPRTGSLRPQATWCGCALRHAAVAVRDLDTARSVTAALVVVVLAIAGWVIAS
jgi:hydrogenase-4 component B